MKPNQSQPELFSGPALRDAGIARVLKNNDSWLNRCIAEAEHYAATHSSFTGEDIRFHCQLTAGAPRHHNAWGALINVLIRRGVIHYSGKHRPMRDNVSHARSTPIYNQRNPF